LLLLVNACVVSAAAQEKAPDLLLKDVQGRTISLSKLRGNVVLLNFWATWCVPCRTEIPDLIRKQRKYRDRGLVIVGITYPPQRISEVVRFKRKLEINYLVVVGAKKTKRVFTSSEILPLTVIIDREGNVQEIIEGIMYDDEFEQKVKPLLTHNTLTEIETSDRTFRAPPATLIRVDSWKFVDHAF
jgi:thiol-disulfide isomerase/thioredoxin